MACATLALPVAAQQQQNIRSVVHYHLKTDRIADFQAAFKDWSALLKKNGSERYFTVWSSQTGPREFVVVRYYSKWADLEFTPDPKMKDSAAAVAAIQARINQCTDTAERWIDEMIPELSLPRATTVPKMVRSGRVYVQPGKMDDVLAIFKNETFPAMKKAGVTAYGVARARYGTPINELHVYVGLSGWADLDGPLSVEKGMGADAYQKYLAKIRPLLGRTEYTLYSYLPELSNVPAQ
jgi:quinol monooxygenase YgiN